MPDLANLLDNLKTTEYTELTESADVGTLFPAFCVSGDGFHSCADDQLGESTSRSLFANGASKNLCCRQFLWVLATMRENANEESKFSLFTSIMVGAVGLEPTLLAEQEPKSCVSANFTTRPAALYLTA